MVRTLAIAALLALPGCGVDGPPVTPAAQPQPGVSVTGEARMGVVFTP